MGLVAVLAIVAAACAVPVAAADSGDDAPTVRTQAALSVTSAPAVLLGALEDDGDHVDTYWFEYGAIAAYGATTAQAKTTKHVLVVRRAIGGLAPGTTYHFRFVDSNEHGVSYGPDTTFTTLGVPAAAPIAAPGDVNTPTGDQGAATPLPPAAAPAIGETLAGAPAHGTVLVRLPGAARPVALSDEASVPVGAVVDTRRGSVELTTGLPGGETQTGTFHGGIFEIRQPKATGGMTELVLRGALPACGGAGARASATTAKRPPRGRWGRDNHGRFRTRGSNSVATVRRTEWYVADRCDGTLTKVKRGSVSVRDLQTDRTVIVRAGQSYLARAGR